ncbi:MAG: protein-L-isoaspartate(D-aspartate) O-methyltransferase [Planctomycetaceae bacterium]|jgi:protein-L-isoaspartate(D-aspartate) O-methyltransferase|nr:protein-L-isoaspartate(D-aspartate) O-methyltransferase [Planctomycetaceae bacterium]
MKNLMKPIMKSIMKSIMKPIMKSIMKRTVFFVSAFLLLVFCFNLVQIFSAVPDSAEQRHELRLKKFPYIDRAKWMVEYELLPQKGLTNEYVLDVMKRIPRHRFVLPAYRRDAYRDRAIAIGESQTISPPYIVCYMTSQLLPKPTDKILEIGTGSGYQAAVLSLLADEVYTIEIVEKLGKKAENLLRELGFDNVKVKIGDGYKGWAEAAPFDSIIVTCSPESIPQPLIEQLREGGRIIIPLGERYQQAFYLGRKVEGKLVKEILAPALFVPMTGEAEEKRQIQPDPKNPVIVGGDFEESRKDGTPIGWHYSRNVTILSNQIGDGTVLVAKIPSGKFFARFKSGVSKVTNPKTQQLPEFSQILQGFPIDGKAIKTITVSYFARGIDIVPLNGKAQTATGLVMLFDEARDQIAEIPICHVRGNFGWQKFTETINIPSKAKEAILLIGLPAAIGTLDVDNIKMSNKQR